MVSNQGETKRLKKLGKVYRNPYDFGPWYNWCLFLGLINGRKWTSLLWPSRIRPKGTGLEWDTFQSCDIKWNCEEHKLIDASKLAWLKIKRRFLPTENDYYCHFTSFSKSLLHCWRTGNRNQIRKFTARNILKPKDEIQR